MLRLGREGGVFLEGILGARVFLQKGGEGGWWSRRLSGGGPCDLAEWGGSCLEGQVLGGVADRQTDRQQTSESERVQLNGQSNPPSGKIRSTAPT